MPARVIGPVSRLYAALRTSGIHTVHIQHLVQPPAKGFTCNRGRHRMDGGGMVLDTRDQPLSALWSLGARLGSPAQYQQLRVELQRCHEVRQPVFAATAAQLWYCARYGSAHRSALAASHILLHLHIKQYLGGWAACQDSGHVARILAQSSVHGCSAALRSRDTLVTT